MIRIYSANLTKADYEKLSRVLTTGLNIECRHSCDCLDCKENKVCNMIWSAITYCDKKVESMRDD